MIYREFYRELGNLLFAVAKTDGSISDREFEELKTLVVNELRTLVVNELRTLENTTDEFGTDLAFLTEFEFEYEDEMIQSAEDAYRSFVTFVKANEERINPRLRKLSYETANKIANSFRKRNKAELRMLKNLKKDLGLKDFPQKKAHKIHS